MPADTLLPLTEADLPLVRAWRNHADVRRHLFSTHEITEDEHRAWFVRQQADASRRLWLFRRDDLPLGFVQLSGVAPGGIAEWGFYAAPGAPRGTGSALGHWMLLKAYEKAQPATITPFLYSQIPCALLAGWLVYGHIPDQWAVLGMAVIALCGATSAWLSVREGR